MFFSHYRIISLWKRAEAFIWTNLNPLYPRMLCAKFGWNWLSGSGEEDENVISILQRRQTRDKFWSEKLTWVFGSGELKMKLSIKSSMEHRVHEPKYQLNNTETKSYSKIGRGMQRVESIYSWPLMFLLKAS